MALNMDDIMVGTFSESWGSTSVEMVVLYNQKKLTKEKAMKLIKDGAAGQSEYIVVMTKTQFDNIFPQD